MWNLFVKSLIRHAKEAKTVSFLLLLGLYVSVLCMSLMLGYAMGQYETIAGRSEYATLTIEPGNDILTDLNSFINELDQCYGYSISNILLVSRYSDNSVVIGWVGTEGRRWFPFTMGRFFTDEEQANGDNVVFVSDSYVQSGVSSDTVYLYEMPYRVIGTGWIDVYNIQSAISQNAVFDLTDVDQNSFNFMIIPWVPYVESTVPELILVHYDYASNADLIEYQKHLHDIYPESSIHLPTLNSDEELYSENILGIIRACILGLISCITIIQLMSQWIGFYKKELSVYHIAGMTQFKCSLLLSGHWTVFYAIATSLAVTTHYASLSILDIVNANYMPALIPLLIVIGLMFILTIVYCFKYVAKILDIRGGGGSL